MRGNLWRRHARSAVEPRARIACRPVPHNVAPLLVSNAIRHTKAVWHEDNVPIQARTPL